MSLKVAVQMDHVRTVTITGDALDENTETYLVNLTPTAGTTAGPAATGTILDDDDTNFTIAPSADATEEVGRTLRSKSVSPDV